MPRRNHPHSAAPSRSPGPEAQPGGAPCLPATPQRARSAHRQSLLPPPARRRHRDGSHRLPRRAGPQGPGCIVVRLATKGVVTVWPCTSQMRHRHRFRYPPIAPTSRLRPQRPQPVTRPVSIDDVVDVEDLDLRDFRRSSSSPLGSVTAARLAVRPRSGLQIIRASASRLWVYSAYCLDFEAATWMTKPSSSPC